MYIMEEIERYRHLNKYLNEKFGERTLKICIDGEFTCPNRDGTKGFGGCIFCSERGSGDHLRPMLQTSPLYACKKQKYFNMGIDNSIKIISAQVQNYFKSYKAERANKFIVYFQNFTNTYDSLENLRLKYSSALIDDRIVGIAIATRPDCINEEIVKLIKSYSKKYYVFVELGLQTSNEQTAKLINRCYTNEDFSKAVKLLNKYGIDVVTHIMIGLPNEDFKDVKSTVSFINRHNIQGLKIHSCYIVKNTQLEKMYKNQEYEPLSLEYYLDACTYVLTHISPNIIIHRISGDAPKNLLIAPDWNLHKKWIINGIDKVLKEKNLYQGMYYKTKI